MFFTCTPSKGLFLVLQAAVTGSLLTPDPDPAEIKENVHMYTPSSGRCVCVCSLNLASLRLFHFPLTFAPSSS